MPLDLKEYFEKRLSAKQQTEVSKSSFITISRQTGCNGNSIAVKLTKELSSKNKWKYINKEILSESAKQLDLSESQLIHLFKSEKLTHANEIIAALSHRYYKNDNKIKKTITEVVTDFAIEGNVVIVGRAAVGITSKLQRGLHIRITAPVDWRINALKKRKGFEDVDVVKFIQEHDIKKENLIQRFCNMKLEDVPFDLTINCSKFNQNQIVKIIVDTMYLLGFQT
jgi:cytidylate kinase